MMSKSWLAEWAKERVPDKGDSFMRLVCGLETEMLGGGQINQDCRPFDLVPEYCI